MDTELNSQIEMQNNISALVKTRQEQLTELKMYYESKNNKLYKEIVLFGSNLSFFEELFSKDEYRFKCENFLSLALSLGTVLELNNSVKTLLIALKIFEEHLQFIKVFKSDKHNFITKMFEKTDAVPITKNELHKERIISSNSTAPSFGVYRDFYNALNKNDSNFFIDFSKYLAFQTDSKSKSQSNFKVDDFNAKLGKLMSGSFSVHYKFYVRSGSSFDLDYASVITLVCDIFFMLYNKMMDKICYNPNLNEYLQKLDQYISAHFINIVSNDLQKLSELIVKKEFEDLTRNLDKIYN